MRYFLALVLLLALCCASVLATQFAEDHQGPKRYYGSFFVNLRVKPGQARQHDSALRQFVRTLASERHISVDGFECRVVEQPQAAPPSEDLAAFFITKSKHPVAALQVVHAELVALFESVDAEQCSVSLAFTNLSYDDRPRR